MLLLKIIHFDKASKLDRFHVTARKTTDKGTSILVKVVRTSFLDISILRVQ